MSARLEVRQRIRGLYGLADAEASGGDPVALGAALLAGGCKLVQLRAKDWDDADVLAAGRDLRARCRAAGATFILNDRADLAATLDADGAHLGQIDGELDAARRVLGPDRILGRSTHDAAQLESALVDADYVAFGPVYDTPHLSRPKPVRGIDRLAVIAGVLDGRAPLVAIGGVTVERLDAVRRAGADSWAVIGAIAHAEDPVAATRALLGD